MISWEELAKKEKTKPKRRAPKYIVRWNSVMFDQEHGHWDPFDYDDPREDLYRDLAGF